MEKKNTTMYVKGLRTFHLPRRAPIYYIGIIVIVTLPLSKVRVSKVCTINYMVHPMCATILADLHILIGNTKRQERCLSLRA